MNPATISSTVTGSEYFYTDIFVETCPDGGSFNFYICDLFEQKQRDGWA